MKNIFFALATLVLVFSSCKKDEDTPTGPQLKFRFKFDSTQVRLNNLGLPATMPSGHAGQSPVFRKMSAHYVELAPTAFTALGSGKVLYRADETTAGGSTAIDFSKATLAAEGEDFLTIPLKDITPGTYAYLRVSLAYQSYDVKYKQSGFYGTGTVASFLGFNTYITNYNINTQPVNVNANRAQGYWGFETYVLGQYYTATGQAPAGATTVVNPINSSSPIPAGSCVVTGPFASALTITGNETQDIIITVSLSTNKSFEWDDSNSPDGKYEPGAGDLVVDMGVRGLIPIVQ